MTQDNNNICFVAMPIGSREDDSFERWKRVYDQIIKRAVEKVDSTIRCHRADDDSTPEPWWPDVLKHLYEDFLCIADVTEQNANVYYELGIRDVWSNNTIVITQNFEDIKADRQDNRVILYHETDIKLIREFEDRMVEAIGDIKADPTRVRVRVQEFLADRASGTVAHSRRNSISEDSGSGPSTTVLPPFPEPDDETVFRERLGHLLTLKEFRHHWSDVSAEYFEAYEAGKQENSTLYLIAYGFWVDNSAWEEEFFANFLTGIQQYVDKFERDPDDEFAATFQGIRDLTVVVLSSKPVEDKRRITSLLRKYIKQSLPPELETLLMFGLHDHLRLLDKANVVIWDSSKLEHFKKEALG